MPPPPRDPWAPPVEPAPPARPQGGPDLPPGSPGTAGHRRWPLVGLVGILMIALALGAYALTSRFPDPDGPDGAGPGAPPTAPAEPQNLKARAKPFEVTLTWKEGAEGLETRRFLVYRDGSRIGEVTKTSFRDTGVFPDARYRYEVEAVARDGTASEARAKVLVRTLTAPPSTARLSGDYLVVFDRTNDFGFSSTGRDRFKLTWFLTPNCPEGPCTTVMSGDDRIDAAITLRLTGGTYAGGSQVPFLARCGSSRAGGTVNIRLRPTEAKTGSQGWKVLRFEGTVTDRSPAQSGCVSAGTDWKIEGRLVS